MKSKDRLALREAFEPPKPVRKSAFLKEIREPDISNLDFICIQFAYIRKWFVVISLFPFLFLLFSVNEWDKSMVWMLSAWMPFVSATAITENIRSATWNMEEFEMATRFSLKSVLFARMVIIGSIHFVLLFLFVPLISFKVGFSIWDTGVYLLVPYLASNAIGLNFVRRFRGREGVYVSIGVSFFVSIADVAFRQAVSIWGGGRDGFWWLLALLVFAVMSIRECKITIKQTEELVWS